MLLWFTAAYSLRHTAATFHNTLPTTAAAHDSCGSRQLRRRHTAPTAHGSRLTTAFDSWWPYIINGTVLWQGRDWASVWFCSCYNLDNNKAMELECRYYSKLTRTQQVVSEVGYRLIHVTKARGISTKEYATEEAASTCGSGRRQIRK